MRQADTDKNRHRPRVVLPMEECKKGDIMMTKEPLGDGSFFIAGILALIPLKACDRREHVRQASCERRFFGLPQIQVFCQ